MESKFLCINKEKIHYLEQGSGDAIVLLPSFGLTSRSYKLFGQRLAKNYQVIIPDLYKGRASFSKIADSLEDYAELLNLFITRLKIKKFFLVGFSFSGPIAAIYAQMFPSHVLKLLLVSTTIIPIDFKMKLLRSIVSIIMMFYHNALFPGGIKVDWLWFTDGLQNLIRHPRQFIQEALIATKEIITKEYEERESQLTVTSKLLFPDKDELFPLKLVKMMKNIKNLEIEVVDGYHGWFFLDRGKFIRKLINFFNKN